MITSKQIQSNGKVAMWDLGPTKVYLDAVDARHAVDAEPERWAPVDPESPDKYVPPAKVALDEQPIAVEGNLE